MACDPLAQAALLEPKNSTVHQYLGVTIGKKGWLSGAEDEMRKALEIDSPGDPRPLLGLATALRRKGQSEEAIKLYRKVIELQPEAPEEAPNVIAWTPRPAAASNQWSFTRSGRCQSLISPSWKRYGERL